MVIWFKKIKQDLIKLILLPRQFWKEKKFEQISRGALFTGYFLPLLILTSLAVFSGELLSGSRMYVIFPLMKAVRKVVLILLMYIISYITIRVLVDIIHRGCNQNEIHKLTIFSVIPFILVSVITGLFPFLYVINVLGLYSFYIFWTGITELTDLTDKRYNKYIFAAASVLFVSFILLSIFLSKLLTLL